MQFQPISVCLIDAEGVVELTGYFDEAASSLRVGDFIMANTAIDSAIASGAFIVKSNDGTTVDVSNINSFGLVNTD